jgi:hypothetical protein
MTSHESGEIWSLPWHVLQRNLAAGIAVQRPAVGGAARAAIRSETWKKRDAGGSWLVRARQRAVPNDPALRREEMSAAQAEVRRMRCERP